MMIAVDERNRPRDSALERADDQRRRRARRRGTCPAPGDTKPGNARGEAARRLAVAAAVEHTGQRRCRPAASSGRADHDANSMRAAPRSSAPSTGSSQWPSRFHSAWSNSAARARRAKPTSAAPTASTTSGTTIIARRLVDVVLDVVGGARLVAREHQEVEARHVERRAQRRQRSASRRPPCRPRPGRRPKTLRSRRRPAMIASFEKKPEKRARRRSPASRRRTRRGSRGSFLRRPPMMRDVARAAHRVHHRAGAEEQAGLEEGVGEQVEDAACEVRRCRRPRT